MNPRPYCGFVSIFLTKTSAPGYMFHECVFQGLSRFLHVPICSLFGLAPASCFLHLIQADQIAYLKLLIELQPHMITSSLSNNLKWRGPGDPGALHSRGLPISSFLLAGAGRIPSAFMPKK